MSENCLGLRCQLWRIAPGFSFLIPLLVQTFFLHPCYQNNKEAKFIRLALMPITLYLIISRVNDRYFRPLEDFFHMNFTFVSFSTFHASCLSVQFALFDGSVLPYPKKNLSEKEKPLKGNNCKKIFKKVLQTTTEPLPPIAERIKFMVWLLFSPRGIGTSWAPPSAVTPPRPMMSVKKFLWVNIQKIVISQVAFVTCCAYGFACAQHPRGAFGLINEFIKLPDYLENISSYLISIPFGGASWWAIELLGSLLNVIECVWYQLSPYFLPKSLSPEKFDPTRYPDLFNDPWKKTSIIEFWSKGWHTVFRRNILYFGWKPMVRLFSSRSQETKRLLGIMGAMAFSGVFHEYVLAAASNLDPNIPTAQVFIILGLGMVIEASIERHTGYIVGGTFGRLWLGFMVFFTCRNAVLSWIARGLGSSGVPPVLDWTWHRFFLPFGPLLPQPWL
ncbi:hypothetical protein BY996DRAFT_4596850 [Phakopsora pachyrhizi]|nr:hypothetical protein BY996DRAFT_4596850 [Phakopsora pachyrhizi]